MQPADVPMWLHPGYVRARTVPPSASAPPEMAARDVSTRSIANWCDKIPVLDLVSQQKLRNADVVANVHGPKKDEHTQPFTVTGLNLGNAKGTLTVLDPGVAAPTIQSWADRQITIQLHDEDFDELKPKDVRIAVRRADGTASEGRFVLHLGPKDEPPDLTLPVSTRVLSMGPDAAEQLPAQSVVTHFHNEDLDLDLKFTFAPRIRWQGMPMPPPKYSIMVEPGIANGEVLPGGRVPDCSDPYRAVSGCIEGKPGVPTVGSVAHLVRVTFDNGQVVTGQKPDLRLDLPQGATSIVKLEIEVGFMKQTRYLTWSVR